MMEIALVIALAIIAINLIDNLFEYLNDRNERNHEYRMEALSENSDNEPSTKDATDTQAQS